MVNQSPRFPRLQIQRNAKPVTSMNTLRADSLPKFECAQSVIKATIKLQGADEVKLDFFNFTSSPDTQKYWIKKAFLASSHGKSGKYAMAYRITGNRKNGSLFVRMVRNSKG